jgi:threonine/homoserine/homoserine lactone efflux protein
VLSEAIGDVLPAAVGVALSPIPIIAVILVLATPRARSDGPAFALGWVVGMVAVSVVVVVVAHGAHDPDSASADTVNWGKVALGALFFLLASREWRRRPRHGEPATMPKWMQTVDTLPPGKAFVVGTALSAANPKNLALTLAASASIAQAGLSTGDTAIAVAVFVVIASVSVVGPVVWFVIAPERAAKPLESIKQFMSEHNAVIMCVVLLVLGAKLLGDGLGGVGS